MLHSRFGRLSTALGDEIDRGMKNEAMEKIGVTAQAMLDGTLSYFEGAETILNLREEVGVYANDPDFVVFIGVLNEVDYLRDQGYGFNWGLLNEASLQDQISESLEWAKSVSMENCKSLANRYKA